jgi:hypothetical protein
LVVRARGWPMRGKISPIIDYRDNDVKAIHDIARLWKQR